jgi:hypothetical protein
MSRGTKAKSIPSDPEEHAASRSARPSLEPSIPAADPPRPKLRNPRRWVASTRRAISIGMPPYAGLREAGDTARGCVTGGPPAGGVRFAVTFARTGSVADAVVEGPLAGTPSATCIAGKFRSLRVPPFRGSSMTVRKTITF